MGWIIKISLALRKRLVFIPLLLYWPAIFVLTHWPVPRMIVRMRMSDKTLHYIGYLVLVFLLWFAVGAGEKVKWRRGRVWWVIFLMVAYGAIDEWLQGYVNRSPDVTDFFADMAGVFTGLILLWIFSFWFASLLVTGGLIFVLTELVETNPFRHLTHMNTTLYFCAYAFFTLLWTRFVYFSLRIKPPRFKWLIVVLVVPAVFLFAVKLIFESAGNGFTYKEIAIGFAGIAVVPVVILIGTFVRGISVDD